MAATNTLAIFTARDNEPPPSNYATLDFRAGNTTSNIMVLDFDGALDEEAHFRGVMPRNYSASPVGITITLHWMATSATSGNVVWETSIERCTTDQDTDSFGTAVVGTATACSGTSGIVVTTAIAHVHGAETDSVAAAEAFRLKVRRLGSTSASDTMDGTDAELVAVEMRESS